MSFAVKTVLKPVSMATNGYLISAPSLFATSKASSYSHLRLTVPFKPVKLSYSSSLSLSTLFSMKKKERLLRVSVIAAQEEEENPVIVEEQEDGAQDVQGDFNWSALDNDVEGQVSDGVVEAVEAVEDAGGSDEYVEPPEDAKVYVGNLPYDVDSEQLAKLFQEAGVVEIAEIIYNRETDQSRGFGFVTMSTVEEADKAVEMFHRHELNGRYLTVNKAAPKGLRPERPPRVFANTYRIYVGNLPWTVDDERLEQVFSEHGKVVSARVVLDRETGRSRGFGFVAMSSESERNDAIANLDGQILDGRPIRVSVAEDRPPRRGSF